MTEIKGDLISRKDLREAIFYHDYTPVIVNDAVNDALTEVLRLIDNAPAVEVRDGYDLGYVMGLEDGKEQARAEAVEYEYIAVRSYTDGCNTAQKGLDSLLGEGYEFVRASEVVKNSSSYSDYIEYILRRRKQNG